MKESISYTFLLNIIIVFIAISFFAIISIISYAKAFRVNSKIVNAIEIYEGYNKLAYDESISKILTSYGYQQVHKTCDEKEGQFAIGIDGQRLVDDKTNDGTCVYLFDRGDTYSYGVITYMTYDFPIIGSLIRIPVYTRTETIKKLG